MPIATVAAIPVSGAKLPERGSEAALLAKVFAELGVQNSDEWGWDNYDRVLRHLIQRNGARQVLEIGGGRTAKFSLDELAKMGVELTVNDIAASELARLPAGYHTACFDVAGTLPASIKRNAYDLAFSQMVFEHVADGRQAWKNLHEVLTPGGIGIAFLPTLFAFPYIVNWLIPDSVGKRIAELLDRKRSDDTTPVFPARYSWAFSIERWMKPMLSEIGYREVMIVPFYGHRYYQRFPIVRDIHAWFTDLARRRDWRFFSSYMYVVVRK
jgi:SAM-dependent methyltransferase